jgi:hypothetical protein
MVTESWKYNFYAQNTSGRRQSNKKSDPSNYLKDIVGPYCIEHFGVTEDDLYWDSDYGGFFEGNITFPDKETLFRSVDYFEQIKVKYAKSTFGGCPLVDLEEVDENTPLLKYVGMCVYMLVEIQRWAVTMIEAAPLILSIGLPIRMVHC